MTQEVKNKIEGKIRNEADKLYPKQSESFIYYRGASFGYSLASEEIEKLKAEIVRLKDHIFNNHGK